MFRVYCDIHSPNPPILQKWIIWSVALACQIEPHMLCHILTMRSSIQCQVSILLVSGKSAIFFKDRHRNGGKNNLDGLLMAIYCILPVNSLLVQDDFQGAKRYRLCKSSQVQEIPHCLWVAYLSLSIHLIDHMGLDDYEQKRMVGSLVSHLFKFYDNGFRIDNFVCCAPHPCKFKVSWKPWHPNKLDYH